MARSFFSDCGGPQVGPGASAVGRWSLLDRRRVGPAGWFPARSRAGIQAFSRESPDAKSRGGIPPRPPWVRARSLSLARFGGCSALFRSIGYYGAHVRALIWDAFSGRAPQPRGFPLGVGRPPPVCEPTPPSPPSWGAGRYGLRFMGRRPGRKRGRPPQGPPNQKRWVQGGENLSPPWCSFLRLSSKESRAPARGRAGNGALRPEAS